MKSFKEIFLAVSGECSDYSEDKTDLFDLSGLFSKKSVILKNYLSKISIDHGEEIFFEQSITKNHENKIQKLKQERDSYKDNLSEMNSKNKDLKESY